MDTEDDFTGQTDKLIETYGYLYFFKQALDKQKVTRQIIKSAKSKHARESFLFHVICLAMIVLGFTGYTKLAPMEMLYLIPTGVLFLWFFQIRFRRFKKGLCALSKLATGIHAKKLRGDKFE